MRLTLQGALPGQAAQREMAAKRRAPDLAKDIPATARDSAVLALLSPKNEGLAPEQLLDWEVLLIRRTVYNGAHSGQIALPGGKREQGDAGLWATACRETGEEVGLDRHDFLKAGALSALYLPASNFVIYPFVAVRASAAEPRPDPREVAGWKNIPLRVFDPSLSRPLRFFAATGKKQTAPAWRHENFTVWGATAMILAELHRSITSGILRRVT